jgi:adenylate cyclase
MRREVEKFEEAIGLYRKVELDAAERILLELNQHRPAKLYSLYLERISIFRQTPPPPNWDGAFTFTTK